MTHAARDDSGFSLMELLVVAAIVALLAGLAVVAWPRVLAQSRSTACASNLRQLGMALTMYLAEHNNTMPTLEAGRRNSDENLPVIDNTLDVHVKSPGVFACPADRAGLAARTGTSYFWNNALNGQSAANLSFLVIDNPSRIPVLSDKEGFHEYLDNRVNILFADGHASPDLRFFVTP